MPCARNASSARSSMQCSCAFASCFARSSASALGLSSSHSSLATLRWCVASASTARRCASPCLKRHASTSASAVCSAAANSHRALVSASTFMRSSTTALPASSVTPSHTPSLVEDTNAAEVCEADAWDAVCTRHNSSSCCASSLRSASTSSMCAERSSSFALWSAAISSRSCNILAAWLSAARTVSASTARSLASSAAHCAATSSSWKALREASLSSRQAAASFRSSAYDFSSVCLVSRSAATRSTEGSWANAAMAANCADNAS
mmetsp:Transcript_48673/g.136080  ORF Transcript_48673/g.136080 Transcript_48673/m.136080 type:complete len:264 (-) Transcript_48673:2-793(-)